MENKGKWTIVRDYLKSYYTDTLLFIFLISIAVSAISSMLFALSTGGVLSNFLFSSIFFVENGNLNVEGFNPAILSYLIPSITLMIVISVFLSLLDQVVNQSLNIELLSAIKDNRAMKFNNLLNVIKENFAKFCIITLQLVLINFLLVIGLVLISLLVLFLGAVIVANETFFILIICLMVFIFLVIAIAFNTRLTYSYITAKDNPTLSALEAIKLAYRESKGHTFAIFSISLKYVLTAIAPILIVLVVSFIMFDINNSIPLLVIGTIIQLIFPLLLMPHYLSYKIVYYDRELKSDLSVVE